MARGRKKNNDEPINTKIKLKHFAVEKHFDESLTEAPVEEHVILRLPQSLAKSIRELVAKRDLPADLNLTWKDARNGKIAIGSKTLSTTLVDLPCISESLKTLDNKQFYKIADISQMIIAHEKRSIVSGKDYSWPDGLSPVLQNVRNTRFRQRMNKKVVEVVEEEIERILLADFEAEDVTFEVLERKEQESEEENNSDDEEMAEEVVEEDGFDFDLAAAIDDAVDKQDEDDEESGDDSDEDSGEESDPEAEEDPDEKNEENELKIQANSLRHEITAMEGKLAEKEKLASNQVNAIMKERFKGIVEKLARELELKKEQLEQLLEEIADQEES